MENKKEEKPYNKGILIFVGLFIFGCFGGLYYSGLRKENMRTENDSAKVSLQIDLHDISEKLKSDTGFLTPYLNTYIETDGSIIDYTRTEQDSQKGMGIIGVFKTDTALFVHYPLNYEELLLKKNRDQCEEAKLLYRRVDKRIQASTFIYADVDFNGQSLKEIKSPIFNSECGGYACSKYRRCYNLEYFTIERVKIKGILTRVFLNEDSVYYLKIDNAVLVSREELLK